MEGDGAVEGGEEGGLEWGGEGGKEGCLEGGGEGGRSSYFLTCLELTFFCNPLSL